MVLLGVAGAFGVFGPEGAWLGILGSLTTAWVVWRHRWPSELPLRLRTFEAPQGPDERAVMVIFRDAGTLLGWDVGILWFERGGVGFVGRTVSFVLPRSLMERQPTPVIEAMIRVPRLVAKVGTTTVGFVPLARGLSADMTLARLDALPADSQTSETILPPETVHPDLLGRGLTARRRIPFLIGVLTAGAASLYLPAAWGFPSPGHLYGIVRALTMLLFVFMSIFGFAPLPSSVRERLPNEGRR